MGNELASSKTIRFPNEGEDLDNESKRVFDLSEGYWNSTDLCRILCFISNPIRSEIIKSYNLQPDIKIFTVEKAFYRSPRSPGLSATISSEN